MDNIIDLKTPIRTIIVKVLEYDPEILSVFGRTKEKDLFFKDLLTIGCDFYELLELFANCEAINSKNIKCIIDNVPSSKKITDFSEKGIRKMIPHWTSSKYHTATIQAVCNEITNHIENNSTGAHIYNSNNINNKRAYNDTFILLIADSNKFFFDINRKKAYKITSDNEVTDGV